MFFRQYIKAHHISHAALVVGGIGAAVVFFMVGAVIRLLVGPVSLGPLGGTLSNAIAQALPGITVTYDQAAIEWSRDQGRVNLVILGARVFDAEKRLIAEAPKADIDLAAQPLLEGKTVVRRITLVGVQLTLVRNAEGGLRLGTEKDKNQHDLFSRITDAITKRSNSASSLQSFAVRDARLAFFDEPSGLQLVAPKANFLLSTAGRDVKASLDGAVQIARSTAHLTGEFTIPPGKGAVTAAVAIKGLDLRALASDGKSFAAVKNVAMVVDLSASIVLQGVKLVSADFGVGGKGSIVIPGLARGPLQVRSVQIVGRYDGLAHRVLLDDATFDGDRASAHLTGRGELVYDASNALTTVSFETKADKFALNMPGVFAAPVAFKTVTLRGSYLPATRDINLDHAEVASGALSAQASGKITLVPDQAPAINLKGQTASLPVRELLHIWPLNVGEGARSWIGDNISAGTIGPIAFEAHMPAGMLDADVLPEGALKVVIPMTGADVNYIKGLTHLTELRGTATLTGDTFKADITGARVGPLVVTQAHAVISALHVPAAPGDITAHVTGTMPEILALVDLKPLNYPTRFGINASQTKGTAVVDLSVHLPMRKNLRVDDVAVGVKANVKGFVIALGKATELTDGDINFQIDNARLRAQGTAMLADSRLGIDWTEEFKSASPLTTHINVKGTLDEGGRETLGFPSAGLLKGPVGVTAVLTGQRGQLRNADMTMDLTPAVLNIDLLGVNKTAGSPASAHVNATFGGRSVVRSETLKLSGPGIAATASAVFNEEGHLANLSIPSLRAGANEDFSLNLKRDASGTDIAVRGRSLDGTRLASKGSDGKSDDQLIEGPFHISARLDRLMLREGVAVAPFMLETSGIGDRLSSLTLSGSLSKTATVSGDMATDTARHLTISTNDAGLLIKGLFGSTSIRGGKLDLVATLPGRGSDPPKDAKVSEFQGKITARDFKVLNQPLLTRLFTAGSLGGMINLMQGQGIAVDELEVPYSSRNGVISVHDAKATGPSVGATADGYIDRPKNDLALKGTLVPMFGLNNVLGNIPVLGDVLISKEGEGVFGMTYSAHGNADQPEVSVNPLAMLTPGILRRIFEGKIPTAAQAPSNAAPPPIPQPSPN